MFTLDHENRKTLYGEFASMMNDGEKTRQDMVDRAAYVYVTGQFPSHLRRQYTGVLRAVTAYFRRPVALDGRTGSIRIDPQVVSDLALDDHPMVRMVRKKISEGYFIQPSRGIGTRRNFWKVFMFKLQNDKVTHAITVHGDGAILEGWE